MLEMARRELSSMLHRGLTFVRKYASFVTRGR